MIRSGKNFRRSKRIFVNFNDHIIAKKRLGTPASQAESFRLMTENGFLDPANLDRYLVMAKFRNKVVHLYYEIQDAEIYKILQNDLEDFHTFIAEILKLNL